MLKNLSTRVKWAVGICAAFLIVGVGATSAYALTFADRALLGVTLSGHSLTGMTRDEVEARVNALSQEVKVTVVVQGKKTETTLTNAGVSVDAAHTADEVFRNNNSFFTRVGALFTPVQVEPVIAVDSDKAAEFTRKVNTDSGSVVTNASVTLQADGTAFVATEAVAGLGTSQEQIVKVLEEQARMLSSAERTIEPRELTPEVSTAEAQAIADKANKIIALEVTITDGIDNFSAGAADKAQWVTIEQESDGTFKDPTIDEIKVADWVRATAQQTNVQSVAGVQNVNSAGEVLTVAKSGVSGWTVNNADEVTRELVASLKKGENYSGDFDYDETQPEYEKRPVAEGVENLYYKASDGEKWIDIDLSANTVIAYEGGKVVGGPFYMVPGAPDTPTVTGTYHVYLKYVAQDMGCGPGWDYCTKGVPWVTYFTGSYALHGAPWRSSFGWSGYGGSHGCVNMPVDAAKFIYDWSELGTTVVSHY